MGRRLTVKRVRFPTEQEAHQAYCDKLKSLAQPPPIEPGRRQER